MCMYAYVCVCVSACRCVCASVYMCAGVSVRRCACVCASVCMFVYASVWLHSQTARLAVGRANTRNAACQHCTCFATAGTGRHALRKQSSKLKPEADTCTTPARGALLDRAMPPGNRHPLLTRARYVYPQRHVAKAADGMANRHRCTLHWPCRGGNDPNAHPRHLQRLPAAPCRSVSLSLSL